jgi:hypothetical protein
LGLTVWEPGSAVANKADIIDAADRALYQSKKTGRNKVSFVPPPYRFSKGTTIEKMGFQSTPFQIGFIFAAGKTLF